MSGDTFGNEICLTVAGESHGRAIVAVMTGVPAGIPVDEKVIASYLHRRMGLRSVSTARREEQYEILSGTFNGFTTGTPVAVLMPNGDVKSSDYEKLYGLARPGHCDYTNHLKYEGFEDPRGGGHSSGRVTAGIVAAGSVLMPALEKKGIRIASHIKSIGSVSDRDFADPEKDFEKLSGSVFPVLDEKAGELMKKEIESAKAEKDSVGGIVECMVTGVPAGTGEPLFDSVESVISHMAFSVPAVKGIEFGDGFALSRMKGSDANDPLRIADGKIETVTNRNGGINGGISNGMPILFRVSVKPTPSIGKTQDTVNFVEGREEHIEIGGRHDACIAARMPAIIESAAAVALADLLTRRFGKEWLSE